MNKKTQLLFHVLKMCHIINVAYIHLSVEPQSTSFCYHTLQFVSNKKLNRMAIFAQQCLSTVGYSALPMTMRKQVLH